MTDRQAKKLWMKIREKFPSCHVRKTWVEGGWTVVICKPNLVVRGTVVE